VVGIALILVPMSSTVLPFEASFAWPLATMAALALSLSGYYASLTAETPRDKSAINSDIKKYQGITFNYVVTPLLSIIVFFILLIVIGPLVLYIFGLID
jgi:VanZ family protein